MKYIILIGLAFSISFSAKIDLKIIDEQIIAIKPKRVGVDVKSITKLKDPFIFLKEKTKDGKVVKGRGTKVTKKGVTRKAKPKKPKIKLMAILNQNALITNKWYKLNSRVYGYTIVKIQPDRIVLKAKNRKTKILFLYTKNKKIKMK
ncbi:MAG: hypothetical protein GQ570_06335 [Helicobacteraceae bacterium]|nr:hypothetical protein [Helicobacteraceae bacterium]